MAVVASFSDRIPAESARFKPKARLAPGFSAVNFNNSIQLGQSKKMEHSGMLLKRFAEAKLINRERLTLVMSSPEDFEIEMVQLSAARMIKEFYICINEKKLKELDAYISDDCHLEDCSFPYAMEGKKEVKQFFQLLATSMGQNVKFIIEHICENDEFTAGVNWHLEWNKTQIPFTRGCSFYECSQKGDRLLIKKAWVVTESPIKPGIIVLTLLKQVISIFDDFPKAAEWFLKSPLTLLQFLLELYKRLLAIIDPLVAGYFKMWDLIIQLFAVALKTLQYILKKYFG